MVDVVPRSAERRLQQRRGTFPGALLPASGTPGGCRAGSTPGVDPAQNTRPGARVLDDASSSITVTADGSVLYGSYTRYDFARGHLLKFDANGQFQGAYSFGWDSTPAIYTHDVYARMATCTRSAKVES